ncbi:MULTISPECIES: efflux RND transporter periplasmic adaptor subunit [unclassified Rhizobium]|uniref:efflux RND transporter periplasmic adaptor subunit n=1 Tax=unclassified Rhizobium TaxID=2613769 RepID=UPI0010EB6636|nr:MULTISPECIES: efflux RND transporter periplasmic adaptor subunit [unclassified Rhizobium]MBD8650694.1 efflux RND transporter periplasmic adaptor subunit [Rhizobium sp. CFBP 13726]MBP2461507.1 RND family efflux transporter MFP subunit [Rhizobium sp. PvP014]MBP2528902.1 RND family efflux transporter MFP subunit [Rhizobium sp. PvP099]RYE67055.1 MAG: efflux RND transporter periplasmic adaptor subunit [Rhizobiaceae bacterium]
MRIWNQLLMSVAVLLGGLCLWVYLSADAGRSLISMGVPAGMVTSINPDVAEPAAATVAGAPASSSRGGQRGGGESQVVLVATRPVGTGVVNDRLSAIGDGEAIQSVIVMPQATGTVNEILVKSGDMVKKGQILAQLDDDEQIILRDQAQVVLRSAREKSDTYRNLKSFSRLDVLDAQIASETAQLTVTNAELALKRRSVVAPIDGIVGIVAVNIGDNVTTASNIVTIDNRTELLVDFWAPERFAVQVKPGMPVEAASVSRPGRTFEGSVEAVDNRVDPASRTIRIRARIPNVDDELRAGMSFGVTMRFPGETFPSVDPLAVQWDAKGSFVWHIVDHKSVKERVRVIQRNPDAILVSANLKDGDVVATEGLQRVRENGAVRIAGEKPPEVASR